ncbi:hypothetical protein [Sangeribacter muris]|uniref:hypothetical protein n=1 Tax=Sangeribacter muris TaxID=2880703 RepID=UPI00244DC551|nr:hypothetical protein [Sangeribacter muris]
MIENKINYEDALEILTFLAKEKNITLKEFIDEYKAKIIKQKEEVSELINKFISLDKNQQEKIKKKLFDAINKSNFSDDVIDKNNDIDIYELAKLDVNELVKTKPFEVNINNLKIDVSSWADVTDNFVKDIIINNYIKSEDLPFYNNDRSSKAYITNIDKHLNGKDGVFHKIIEGFYVDVKYNAKYHILNIIRTLDKLNLKDIYNIRVSIR